MKHPVMTVAQMKHWEAEQDRQGFSYAQMMENAGQSSSYGYGTAICPTESASAER